MKLLAFQLSAHLSSFGTVAVGERRPTDTRPTKSALVGFIGAALGVQRDDPMQQVLATLAFATTAHGHTRLLTDFHTTASAKTPKRFDTETPFISRRHELENATETGLSRRDYLQGGCWDVVALPTDELPAKKMAAAIAEPVFMLYAGRKSCPLSAPPYPMIVEADTLTDAFEQYAEMRGFTGGGDIHADEAFVDAGLVDAMQVEHWTQRRDTPVSRTVWRHDVRREFTMPR